MSVLNQIISELRQTANGAAVLDDWLGVGANPVPLHQAELRASTCLSGRGGRPCQYNRAPNWWQRFVTDPIAKAIRGHLEVKNGIGLRVEKEESLHMCSRCGCCLALKVHVPIEHIKAHHKPEYQLPAWCWQLKEMEMP